MIKRVTAGVNHIRHKDPNGQPGGEVVLGVVYTGGFITAQRGMAELLGEAWYAFAEKNGLDPVTEITRVRELLATEAKRVADLEPKLDSVPGLQEALKPKLITSTLAPDFTNPPKEIVNETQET